MKAALAGLALGVAAPAWGDAAADYASAAAGSWTSAEQAADPAYDWVESEVVRIWTDREDGVWLYQENAILGEAPGADGAEAAKARPYFQVVIQLRDMGGGVVHSTTYRVADRAAAKGVWAQPGAFDPAWLGEVSCMGTLERIGAGFWRGEADCPNTYKDAVKVVSRSVRAPGVHVNWDRGVDAEGGMVWGPSEGGYIFKRKGDGG